MRKLLVALSAVVMLLYASESDTEQIDLPWWDNSVLGAPCTAVDIAEQGCVKIEILSKPMIRRKSK